MKVASCVSQLYCLLWNDQAVIWYCKGQQTTGDKPAEYGFSPHHAASALDLIQKNTVEVEQTSLPANFSRSAEVVNALQD